MSDNDELKDTINTDEAGTVDTEQANVADNSEAIDGEISIESLQAELIAAQELAEQAKDEALRAKAEAQNMRRRSETEVDKARKFALEKFSGEIVSVLDNLERALATVDQSAEMDEMTKGLVEGVNLTCKSFVDVLSRFNIEQIDPHGEPFNPELHEAMTMVPSPNVEPNTVIDVVQKGYSLNGRVIRAAMVVVSKA